MGTEKNVIIICIAKLYTCLNGFFYDVLYVYVHVPVAVTNHDPYNSKSIYMAEVKLIFAI